MTDQRRKRRAELQAKRVAANPEKHRAIARNWYRANRHKAIERLFGLSKQQYDALLSEQGNVCAICKGINSDGSSLSVDHDHRCCKQTGRSCGKCIRGLLCGNCNRGIGNLQDSPELLFDAMSYILRHADRG